MGKPYESELAALPETYDWAMKEPIDDLVLAVRRLSTRHLIAVGSGGSFSVCHFAAHLHRVTSGHSAMASTPLEAINIATPVTDRSVVIPTAGGNNPDVVAALRILAEREPRSLLLLSGNPHSKAVSQASRYQFVDAITKSLPFAKDGFLATNSLLAFSVLLARAYSAVFTDMICLPKRFQALLSDKKLTSSPAFADRRYVDLLSRETLLVLHGPSTLSAAIDTESKFSEAALGRVIHCDYRQFAHGRHHWIDKRGDETGILAFVTAEDEGVAAQTLGYLPPEIPCVTIAVPGRGCLADLSAICETLYFVGAAGRRRLIDPGRPGVPAFGRKLYHANAFRHNKAQSSVAHWKARAIQRKASLSLEQILVKQATFWSEALERALNLLTSERFIGLVTDYDGTLCCEDQRFDPLPDDSVSGLRRILDAGYPIGIATGRGKSVRENLRKAFPKQLWQQILVGYYNGSEILPLSSDELPDGSNGTLAELDAIAEAVTADMLLAGGAVTLRRRQITLSPPPYLSLEALLEHAEALVNQVVGTGFRVMRSGHSVDIVPEFVSKLSVVRGLIELSGANDTAEVLRFGDRGRWPGNDSQLLASPYGLSVHEVSSDVHTCWNIAPSGYRGQQAMLWYLRHISVGQKGLRFKMPSSGVR